MLLVHDTIITSIGILFLGVLFFVKMEMMGWPELGKNWQNFGHT